MEIFETTTRDGVLCFKAKGRQRCKIVPGQEIRPLAGRLQKITVKILAEPAVTSPLCNSMMWSLKTRRHNYKKIMIHFWRTTSIEGRYVDCEMNGFYNNNNNDSLTVK